MSALAELGVHADRDGLHVMPPEQLQGAVSMQEECKEFLAKTKQFNDIVGDFIDVMESKSKVIEAEKLRAIGLANRVEHEKEVRKRKQLEVQAMINEKKAELERLNAQHESIVRVEAEQKALIEKVRAIVRGLVDPTVASLPPLAVAYVYVHMCTYPRSLLPLPRSLGFSSLPSRAAVDQ